MLLKKVVKFVGESYKNILENVLKDIFKIIWNFFFNNFAGDPSLKLVKKKPCDFSLWNIENKNLIFMMEYYL